MFVPSSNERPVGRYPSPSPLSRFSSSCISFHFTPFRGPMLPAGPSLFKSPLPRLQWLPDLQDMGPDWGPRSLRSVFYPGSPSSQRRGPPSPVPGPLPTPCLPRHRWADATLAGLRLPYAGPCQRTPRLPPPPLLPHPPTTVPLYLVPLQQQPSGVSHTSCTSLVHRRSQVCVKKSGLAPTDVPN